MCTCCRRTYSVTGHGCGNTQKDSSWNLAHQIRCTLGLCHNQERGLGIKGTFEWVRRGGKKNTLGKKGYNYSCAEFKGQRFYVLDILASPPYTDLNSKAQTWMKMSDEFIQVPIKGKHLKASEYVCTAIDNTPCSKERKPHFLPLPMHSLQGERCLYFSHPTKHTCLKTKGEAGILIWQTFGQCYTLVVSQYSSATKWTQE